MVRLFLAGLALSAWSVSGAAVACPLESAAVSVGVSGLDVVSVPIVGVSVYGAVVPQAVLVAPSHCVVDSFGARGVLSQSAVVAVRPRSVLRSRVTPLRASSRVTVRTRGW